MTGMPVADRPTLERTLAVGALAALILLSTIYTVAGVGMEMSAVSMTFGDMGGMAAGSSMSTPAPGAWSTTTFVTTFLMWWLMMIAMMLPSATPAVLLFTSVLKQAPPEASAPSPALVLTGGYLAAWAGFSMLATAMHWALEAHGLISPSSMTLTGSLAGALLAIAAGSYQFSPLKRRCLTHCRAPAEFVAQSYRPGRFGAFRLGALHGAFCLGCCIALMTLLFVGGVMNLFWIIGLAGLVALEKLGTHGRLISHIAGLLFVAFGVFRLGMP